MPEQKWDFISLNDFKATSCYSPFAYGFLWFSFIISIAFYGVDVFTAYQLLAFNRWSSQIKPTLIVPFDVSKWIFTGCIILSFVNLAYEFFRAIAIMRRGSVAECFLDSLAARLESVRLGGGRGWRRFLVFAELTKSKKGAEYIALFTFFSFQSWIRVLLCSGPRQAINALTLYSVYKAELHIESTNFEAGIADFFDKIGALASQEPKQVVILSGMLFTLVIWIFSFLSLLLAALFFVLFLWNYIPREDGGLTGFCARKINKRLTQIVQKKINKAMAEDERKRRKAELKAAKKNGDGRPITMKPSIPVLKEDDDLPDMPSLNRADTFVSFAEKPLNRAETFASFTEKPSRTNTTGSFEMNALGRKPPMPLRSETKASAASQYSANASLLQSAAEMGMDRSDSRKPTIPPMDLNGYPAGPARTATGASNRNYGPGPGGPGPHVNRMLSNGSSLRAGYTASPAPYSSETMPSLPPRVLSPAGPYNAYMGLQPNRSRDMWPAQNNMSSFDDYSNGRPTPRPNQSQDRWQNPVDNRPPFDSYHNERAAPYPSQTGGRLPFDDYSRERATPQPSQPGGMFPPAGDNRLPFDNYSNGRAGPAPSPYANPPMIPRDMEPNPYPLRSATIPVLPQDPGQFLPPLRAMTAPMQPFHQATSSNGSLRSNGSQKSNPASGQPYRPYHQPSASGSSLRNVVNTASHDQQSPREQPGPVDQSNLATTNTSREPPRVVDRSTYDPYRPLDDETVMRPNPTMANTQKGPPRVPSMANSEFEFDFGYYQQRQDDKPEDRTTIGRSLE
ncbi:Potassium transporter [Collariella sp. IMI 366227]|nr:Potassium transporter [Collariella sp. IMI 366227]